MHTPNTQRRAAADRLIDTIAADVTFHRQLLDDPRAALARAGLLEDIEALQLAGDAEVTGYAFCEDWPRISCWTHQSS